MEPINTILENVKDALNAVLDKELCIDFLLFGEKLKEAIGYVYVHVFKIKGSLSLLSFK